MSSVPPLGRRGRLANLAATIGSWEDDLSHANIPQEKVGAKSSANVPRLAEGDSAVAVGAKTRSSADSTCSQVGLPHHATASLAALRAGLMWEESEPNIL